MATMQEIIDRAAKLGEKSSAWIKGDYARIYVGNIGRKDIKVWLECEMAGSDVTGASFHVSCSTPQAGNWIRSQIAIYRKRHIALWHAYVILTYKDSDLSGFGPDIVGMINEAREFAAEYEREQADGQD